MLPVRSQDHLDRKANKEFKVQPVRKARKANKVMPVRKVMLGLLVQQVHRGR